VREFFFLFRGARAEKGWEPPNYTIKIDEIIKDKHKLTMAIHEYNKPFNKINTNYYVTFFFYSCTILEADHLKPLTPFD